MGDAEWCACRGETGHTELSGTLQKQKTAQRGGNVSGQERVSTGCPTSSAGVTNLARDDSVRTHLAFNFHFIVTFAVIKNNKEFLNLSNKYNLFCGSTFSPAIVCPHTHFCQVSTHCAFTGRGAFFTYDHLVLPQYLALSHLHSRPTLGLSLGPRGMGIILGTQRLVSGPGWPGFCWESPVPPWLGG